MSPLPDISQIASFRRRLGVTQKRIAIESGVSQSLISKIEAGRVMPTYENAKLIIDALERIEMESESVGMRQDKTKRGRSLPVLEAIRKFKCRIVLATGMVSRKGAEKQVENQAVQGIILVQLQTGRHVITAFFDEHETR